MLKGIGIDTSSVDLYWHPDMNNYCTVDTTKIRNCAFSELEYTSIVRV